MVSAFATLGDVLKPKSFAGFAAAPSVALAMLGLTIMTEGKVYAAREARSMIAGALAFCVYALVSSPLMMRENFCFAITLRSQLPPHPTKSYCVLVRFDKSGDCSWSSRRCFRPAPHRWIKSAREKS